MVHLVLVEAEQVAALRRLEQLAGPSAWRIRTTHPWTTLPAEAGWSCPQSASAIVSVRTGEPPRGDEDLEGRPVPRTEDTAPPSTSRGTEDADPHGHTVTGARAGVNHADTHRCTHPLAPHRGPPSAQEGLGHGTEVEAAEPDTPVASDSCSEIDDVVLGIVRVGKVEAHRAGAPARVHPEERARRRVDVVVSIALKAMVTRAVGVLGDPGIRSRTTSRAVKDSPVSRFV